MKEELIDILICPQSKQPVIYVERSQELWCKASRLAYPIRDEIPILLVGNLGNSHYLKFNRSLAPFVVSSSRIFFYLLVFFKKKKEELVNE
ncbi:MAG: hypothetical protein Ct9H90mP27_4480 [Gammaproteobacteria bacterium]|nr:MAG: hypothetical protein Ct9H90mP27_4480 [Gammaproteobacteria bacterium]